MRAAPLHEPQPAAAAGRTSIPHRTAALIRAV